MTPDPPAQIKHHQLKDLIGYQDLTFEFGESIDMQTILLSKTRLHINKECEMSVK